jgi:hypothetical protein
MLDIGPEQVNTELRGQIDAVQEALSVKALAQGPVVGPIADYSSMVVRLSRILIRVVLHITHQATARSSKKRGILAVSLSGFSAA